MRMFGPGRGRGGFAALLRRHGVGNINMDVDNSEPGASPEQGGSAGNRRPNDAATQRHMDAKDSAGKQKGGLSHTRGGRVPRNVPGHRIAEGSVGTNGRIIHHPTEMKRKGEVPSHISTGPIRSGKSSHKISRSSGSTGMSDEVSERPGVPAHQSVINRGPKPHGGYKHAKKIGMSRRINMAHKLAI